MASIGVVQSMTHSIRGTSTSDLDMPTMDISTTPTMFGLFGLYNYLSPQSKHKKTSLKTEIGQSIIIKRGEV